MIGSYWALINMPTSIVNIIVSSLPLITLPFAFIVLGERIRILSIFTFILGILGVYVTLAGGASEEMILDVTDSQYGLPAAILLGSVVALAFGNVMVKPIIFLGNLIPICATHFLTSGLAALILSFITERYPGLEYVAVAMGPILFLSFFGSILGTFIWLKLLTFMTASEASLFFLVTPLFGLFFGVLFFDESISLTTVYGVVIICLSIAISFALSQKFKG